MRVRVQVEAAAFSVHSPIYTDNKALEREGDAKLRGYFHDRMMDVLVNRGFKVRHATTTTTTWTWQHRQRCSSCTLWSDRIGGWLAC